MFDPALAVTAFALTALETGVGARYTQSVVAKNVRVAVGWGVLFEGLLLADVWFLMTDKWLAIPILAGSAVGIWWVVRK